MKIQTFDGSRERYVVTSMIVSTTVLSRVVSLWRNDRFSSKWANIVGRLCVNYYTKYGKAPKKQIESLIRGWGKKNQDKATIEAVDKFVTSLSHDYESRRKAINAPYAIDQARAHFLEVKLDKTLDTAKGLKDAGKIDDAINEMGSFSRGEFETRKGTFFFNDDAALVSLFDRKSAEVMVKYNKGLRKFFGISLSRGKFVAFVGREKIGKSFFLFDLAYRAMIQGRRVALFGCGDMTDHQMQERLISRMAMRPYYKGTVKYPKSLRIGKNFNVATTDTEYPRKMTLDEAKVSRESTIRKRLQSTDPYFYMEAHDAGSLSVDDIEGVLGRLEREQEWTADVVVIDYADIMRNSGDFRMEKRERINQTWIDLRALSSRRNCLVVTATQSNRVGFNVKTLQMEHIGEDHRKLAHATSVVGINCSDLEKDGGIYRLNWMANRDVFFPSYQCCWCAACLPIANPCILSEMESKAQQDSDKASEDDD